MPRGNQQRQNRGADRGWRDEAQAAGQRIEEGAARVSQQLGEGYGMIREEAAHRYRDAERMVAQHPMPSVLIGFGLGFGFGLVLTTLLTRPEESWAERYLPDRIRRAPETLNQFAEAVARHLPNAMRQG